MDAAREQELASRLFALNYAARLLGQSLIERLGDRGRREVEEIRRELILDLKNSAVPPERELEHADIMRPAIESVDMLFDGILRQA